MRSTRDAIVDAALGRFASDGFATPLRTIAADAGVSAALIVHHFGSKQGLRDAVDELVLGTADQKLRVHDESGPAAAAAFVVSLLQDGRITRYLARVLVEDSAAGERLFISFTDAAEKALVELDLPEPRMTAALLVSHALGGMVMANHIGAATGRPPFSPEGLQHWVAAVTSIYGGALSRFLP